MRHRCLSTIALLALALSTIALNASRADTPLTKDEAVARVRSAGYPLVAKLEKGPDTWNVWASKNGITYQVQIDSHDGSVIAAIPVEAND